jgi:hypothetical protein
MFFHVVMFQKMKYYLMLIVILWFYVHIKKMLTYDILIHKIFQPHEIFNVIVETNATCVENVKN